MQLVEQGRLGLDDPAEKYLPELAGLKVFESFDAATGAYTAPPGIAAGDGPALPDPHVRTGLSVHQRDLARFQAARRRDLSVRRAAAVRSGRALALQHQHRRRRQAGRGGVRPEARGLFPPAHLRAAEDGRHVLQRAGGEGTAPRRAAAARRRAHGRRRRAAERRSPGSPSRRRSAAAASPRPPTTTAASCACCSTAARSTARAC